MRKLRVFFDVSHSLTFIDTAPIICGMLEIDRNKARDILVKEHDFTAEKVDSYLELYPLLHEDLREPVEAWFKDRTVQDFEVDGISIKQVMEAQGTHFLNAVRGLNDLLTKELTDEEREALKTILTTPLVYS